jgi:GntR family transcriptional repressor for pyruvate dehydrogenase complex
MKAAPKQTAAAGRVVEFVRRLIEAGKLGPGDRLPAERELAGQVGVSRPSLRSGLRTLQAMGVVRSRQGSGTYVTDGPPRLSDGPLRFLAALHGFERDEMFEARRVLEVAAAGLAAGRARPEVIAAMAEEVASMFATLEQPVEYLVHDVQFHRAVAAGSGNRVLETLIDTVSELVYEDRRNTAQRARDLRESAEMHRRIYRAIKAHDGERARSEMATHLEAAREAQAREEEIEPGGTVEPGTDEGRGDRAPRVLPGTAGGRPQGGSRRLRQAVRRGPAGSGAARD